MGAPPFGGATPESVVKKQVFEVPLPLSAVFAPAFDELVRRALHKDPIARFASARQMRAAVAAAVQASEQHVTLEVGAPPSPDRTRPLDFGDDVGVCRGRSERPTGEQLTEALVTGRSDDVLHAYLRLAHRMTIEGDHESARRGRGRRGGTMRAARARNACLVSGPGPPSAGVGRSARAAIRSIVTARFMLALSAVRYSNPFDVVRSTQ